MRSERIGGREFLLDSTHLQNRCLWRRLGKDGFLRERTSA
jgi:hypothetical protein